MKKSLLTLLALLCVVVQGSWAQQVVDALTYGLQLNGKLNGAKNTLPLKDN